MPIRMTGLNSGLDTESIISALVSSYSYKTDKYKKAQTKLSWKQDAWKALNTKIYSLYKSVGNLKYSSAYNMKKTTVSDSSKASVTASNGVSNGTYSVQITQLAKSGYLTGAKLDDAKGSDTKLSELGYSGEGTLKLTTGGKTTEITVSGDSTISDVVKQLSDAGVKANYDSTNKRIFISASGTGKDNDFTLEGGDGGGTAALKALGLVVDPSAEPGKGATRVEGTDSKIYVNGALFEGATNTVSVNGLTINATGVTGSDFDPTESNAITVTTSTDTQGIYDKIKDFLTQYNALVNEMTSLYNADSAKGYDPLTDDEKDQMSDKEVEKWEQKIKDSILRRDDTLSGVLTVMTSAMSKSFNINGKNYSLSSFGIMTLGTLYSAKNEQNAYHIDGDEDDSATSGKADKLMAAINEDPDAVIDFMKNLTSNLYSELDKKMKSTTLSSVYTVYNDKEMASEYSNYSTTISKWEQKLKDKEDYYYKKFSAMETALAKLNSQTSSLTNLFGG